jgi:signal transduction histidine kinase
MPHEFRTVISQLKGSATEIIDGIEVLDKADVVELGMQMISVCDRLGRIVNNFLMSTQLDSYANSPDSIKDLRSSKADEPMLIINDLAETISQKYDRIGEIEIIDPVFEIAVAMNSELFNKMADELIDNAFKFSQKETKITIKSVVVDNLLKIEIIDEGIGMTPEQLKDITAFVQFDREENEQQGMGVGLSIARKIVELHGGTFDITSEKGK